MSRESFTRDSLHPQNGHFIAEPLTLCKRKIKRYSTTRGGCVLRWRPCRHRSTHPPLVGDPLAGREQIGQSMQFKKIKKHWPFGSFCFFLYRSMVGLVR